MKKIQFIYFGRLEKEKGFDLVLGLIKYYRLDPNIQFEIFGAGSLELELSNINSKNLIFHGWKDFSDIKKSLLKSHFTLMPSICLESFGLSALESISCSIPVISFGKGGLKQFTLDELDISRQYGQKDVDKLITLIDFLYKSFSDQKWKQVSIKSLELSKKYSSKLWLNNFKTLINPDSKKILIVSDYISNIGGIENHIHSVKELLLSNGYECKLFGLQIGKTKFRIYIRKLLLICTGFNPLYYFKLKLIVKKYKPDLIRYHSVLRFLGRSVFAFLNKIDCQKFIIYHDFGYFVPFPNILTSEDQIPQKRTLVNFIKSGQTKNLIKIFYITMKFISINFSLHFQKKHIDCYIIPSLFMKKYLIDLYGIDENKIFVINHYN